MTSPADAAANTPEEFFGAGFGYENKVLTIPSKTLTQTTPQFDFMFSNVYERDLNTNPDYVTPVALEFSHLFTAFGVTAKNLSENTIKIQTISISGFKNNRSATITYNTTQGNSNSVVVGYGNGVNDATFTFSPNKTLTTDAVGMTSAEKNATDFYLMWPHLTTDDISSVKINITYLFNDEKSPLTKEIALPDDFRMVSGKKNIINIVFDIDQITFIIKEIIPWNTEENDIPVQM